MGKRKICPRCGSNSASRILYGLIDGAVFEALGENVVLGGCVLDIDSPTTQCNRCEYKWGGKQPILQRENVKLFTASIGGYFGPCVDVMMDSGTVTFSYTEDRHVGIPERKQSQLSDDQMERFFHMLDYSDFIDWVERYHDNTTLDGTLWHVEVELADGTIMVKSGSNAYPGRWKYFCKKLSELAGGRFA